MSLKKVCLKWCNWTMTFMIQPYFAACNFSFKFDFDMPCVFFILNILNCMYRGFYWLPNKYGYNQCLNLLFKKINVLIYVLIFQMLPNKIGQNKFSVIKFLNIFCWPIKIKKITESRGVESNNGFVIHNRIFCFWKNI